MQLQKKFWRTSRNFPKSLTAVHSIYEYVFAEIIRQAASKEKTQNEINDVFESGKFSKAKVDLMMYVLSH